MSEHPLAECQFCSVVSKANGEDPIGSAGTHDYWLLTELALPWSEATWQQDPAIAPIISMLREAILHRGLKLRPLAIAPDRAYSQPGHRRVLFYRRPAQQFAHYDKHEYLIPTDQLAALIQALIEPSSDLAPFTPYRQATQPSRDLLVCTHGNVDVACSRFGYPIYRQLRQKYAGARDSEGVTHPPTVPLRVWRCSHFGGHRFAPTLIDLPQGQYWGHLEPDLLAPLVQRQGALLPLRRCYRGWAGLSPLAQIVEREVWMQQGWDWLTYAKAGHVKRQDAADPPRWAEIHLEFYSPLGEQAGVWQARVEQTGEVMTASKSGHDLTLKPVPQYQVTHLALSLHP